MFWGPAALAQDMDGDGVADAADNCLLLGNPGQQDGDGDGWGNRCDADFDNDGQVSASDLGLFKASFFSADPVTDLNGDGIVNVLDLGLLRELFFGTPGPAGVARWVGPGSGDWDDPANWLPPVVPAAQAHVRVDQAGALTLYAPNQAGDGSPDMAAASIVSNQNLTLTAGSLTVPGDVDVAGVLTVAGGALRDATLRGGTVQADGGGLERVTLATDVVVTDGATLDVHGLLILDGGDVFIAAATATTTLRFVGLQAVQGNGNIWFAGTAANDDANRILTDGFLVVRSGVTIASSSAGGRVVGTLELEGEVRSDVSGKRITLDGDLELAGPVTAINGALLTIVGDWHNAAGNVIAVTDGELELGGSWSNDGQIVLSNSPLIAGGSVSAADFANLQTDASTTLVGDFDNAGNVLNVDDIAAGLVLGNGATIAGGTLTANEALTVGAGLSGVRFDGVTVAAPLFLEFGSAVTGTDLTLAADTLVRDGGSLEVSGSAGITLNAAAITLASDGSITRLAARSVSGSGSIELAGTTTDDTLNQFVSNGSSFFIDAGVAVRTQSSGGFVGGGAFNATLNGPILVGLPGRSVSIRSTNATVGGSLSIGPGSRLQGGPFVGQFAMAAGAALDIDIGPLDQGVLDLPAASFVAAGTLNLALVDGAAPAACETRAVVLPDSVVGAFAAINGPDLGGATFAPVVYEDEIQVQAPGVGCTIELSRLAGVIETASSEQPGFNLVDKSNDGDVATAWCARPNDDAPFLNFQLPSSATVVQIDVVSNALPQHQFFTGRVTLLDDAQGVLFDSGVLALSDGNLSVTPPAPVADVRSARFEGITFGSLSRCISEFDVIGRLP